MAIRGLFLLLAAISTLLAFTSATSRMTGGYVTIQNVHDPEVVNIAKFAVTEHNKDKGTNLKYMDVVSGQTQVVDGVNYRLIISADDGTNKLNYYEAIVYEDPVNQDKTLTSFRMLLQLNN